MQIVTLGWLIEAIETCVPDDYNFLGDGIELHSYRGAYRELAIWHSDPSLIEPENGTPKSELLKLLKGAIGSTFNGYKGGDYNMCERSLVFLDPYGGLNYGSWEPKGNAVCGIEVNANKTFSFRTADLEF